MRVTGTNIPGDPSKGGSGCNNRLLGGAAQRAFYLVWVYGQIPFKKYFQFYLKLDRMSIFTRANYFSSFHDIL